MHIQSCKHNAVCFRVDVDGDKAVLVERDAPRLENGRRGDGRLQRRQHVVEVVRRFALRE